MNDTIEGIKQQLAQLKELHASGVLPEAEFTEGKATLERRILDLVLSAPAAATVSPSAASAPAGAAAPSGAKPSGLLLAGLALAVLVLAAGGYLWKAAPAGGAAAAAGEAAPAAMADGSPPPHATNSEQIAAMAEKLALRLKDKPDDVEGWSMLARSYSVLGRHGDALQAYEKAANLRKDDSTLLADYADSMAVNNGNNLAGEPMKLVERALKVDPKNLKALYLSGTYAFNKQDYASAVKIWEKLVEVGPPGNIFVREVEPAIVEARNLAGLPAGAKQSAGAAPEQAKGAAAAGPAAAAGTVSGTVTLSASLAKQAQPQDTLFVFARAEQGSRMPLAILRKQVKDLPLSFSLNDSMAMSPANSLSATGGKVIVGARISKSGNAMPQPGDLLGQSRPVAVGAAGLQIEIRETVTP